MENLLAIGISSVDSDGTEHYYGPFNVGQPYGNLAQLEPIAWNHIRDEADAQMQANGYVKDRVNGYHKVSTHASAASTPSASIMVSQTGMVKLTVSELLNAGLDLSQTKHRHVALLDHTGNAVVRSMMPRGKQGTLGLTGEIYFYAQAPTGHDALYSQSSYYRIVVDPTRALDAQLQRQQGITDGYSALYQEQTLVETNNQYSLSAQTDDPWVDRVITSYPDKSGQANKVMTLPNGIDQSAGMNLRVGVGRESRLGASVDGIAEHELQGVVYDAASTIQWIDSASSSGPGAWDVSLPIPSGLGDVYPDQDGLQVNFGVKFTPGAGFAFSTMQLDYMGVEYWREYVAKSDESYLNFTGPNTGENGYEVQVPNTGYALAFAHADGNLVRIIPESQAHKKIDGLKHRVVKMAALNGAGTSSVDVNYWVSGKGGFIQADEVRLGGSVDESSLLAQAQAKNYLMIAHPALMGNALTDYASFKQGQGYTVAIIDYLDVVAAYGGGQAGPVGLTRYLNAVESNGSILEYVLLVGGSTYDHHDQLGTGAMTFIPSHYGESGYSQFTASDSPYVTDEQNNLFASIGRWPARNQSDVQIMVDKSKRWSQADHSEVDALVIAENTVDGEYINFGAALNSIAQSLPAHTTLNKVYVDEILANNPSLSLPQALTQAKGQIIDQINEGTDVVMYNGHGTTSQFSNQGLFKSSDVNQITGSGAELWVPMSCYVTYYESTHVNTLAHQLMFSGNAVNITGATLLSSQSDNLSAGRAILDKRLNDGLTIGESVRHHKMTQDSKFKMNWSLLGDPTL